MEGCRFAVSIRCRSQLFSLWLPSRRVHIARQSRMTASNGRCHDDDDNFWRAFRIADDANARPARLPSDLKKEELRPLLKALRETIPLERRKSASSALTNLLVPRLAGIAGPCLSFASFGSELDTWDINRYLASVGKLALPRVEGRELGIYLVSDIERQTQSGMWGIREPIPGECGARLKPIELAVILAPGLGFDREGRRIGYGAGFYDRLLPHISADCRVVGVGYQEQLCERVPTDDQDYVLPAIFLF